MITISSVFRLPRKRFNAGWLSPWVLFFPFVLPLSAQTIFPDLSGQALLDALSTGYRPATVLGYGPARDLLYGDIDRVNDSLYCVYTGFGIAMTPGADPSSDAFSKGINTEHTYPRSKGAESGFPESDMHHLFPTRVEVNGDRGSLPFGDVPDDQTNRWYFRNQERSSPPPVAVRDLYSELRTNSRFEPREDFKGNVARAVFYFYTVYGNEARAADADFFDAQVDDLCSWHAVDPVDLRELERSQAIATYQDGKVNPFVADCDLLRRTYCPDLEPQNCLTSTEEISRGSLPYRVLGVNRESFDRHVFLELSEPAAIRVDWYDALGRQLSRQSKDRVEPGTLRFSLGGIGASATTSTGGNISGPILARFQIRGSDGRWHYRTVLVP